MSSFIPPEIITHILSKLSVKSLLRFRCVSKPWCSLIDSPDFVKMHLNQSMKTISNRYLILGFANVSIRSVDLHSICSPGVDSIDFSRCLEPPFPSSVVCSFCNGLSLVYIKYADVKYEYIWNPFTRKYRKLPAIPFAREYPSSIYLQGLPTGRKIDFIETEIFGFAYVSEADEYKVVQVIQFMGLDSRYIGNDAYMFSSKSNEWERLEPFRYRLVQMRGWGAHLNGALHSVVDIDLLEWLIIVFDTKSKQHSVLPIPEFDSIYVDVKVEVLEGSLCLINNQTTNIVDVRMDIWVMKEYGVKASWYKKLSVVVDPFSFKSMYPLTYSEDGAKILMNYNCKELIWYNMRGKRTRKVTLNNVLPMAFYTEVCFESLVSFPGFVGVDDGKTKSQDNEEKGKRHGKAKCQDEVKGKKQDGVNKKSQQKTLKEKGNTSLIKGFLSQGFNLNLNSTDDGKAKGQNNEEKGKKQDDVNKNGQQKTLKEKGNTSLTKGFLSQGFNLNLNSTDDGKAKSQNNEEKGKKQDDVNKEGQQKTLTEKGSTSLTKGFLSQGFKLKF